MSQNVAHHKRRQPRVLFQEVEVTLRSAHDALYEGQIAVAESVLQRGNQLCHFLLKNVFEKIFLSVEIIVQHGVRHARALGNGGSGGGGKPVAQEHLFGGFQNELGGGTGIFLTADGKMRRTLFYFIGRNDQFFLEGNWLFLMRNVLLRFRLISCPLSANPSLD